MREELKNNLNIHFQIIYKDILDQNEILKLINKVLDLFENKDQGITEPNWSQKDIFLITYVMLGVAFIWYEDVIK